MGGVAVNGFVRCLGTKILRIALLHSAAGGKESRFWQEPRSPWCAKCARCREGLDFLEDYRSENISNGSTGA
jgi:hypothetical protein